MVDLALGGELKNADISNAVSMDFALELTLLKQRKIHPFVFQIAVPCRSPRKKSTFSPKSQGRNSHLKRRKKHCFQRLLKEHFIQVARPFSTSLAPRLLTPEKIPPGFEHFRYIKKWPAAGTVCRTALRAPLDGGSAHSCRDAVERFYRL